MYFPTLLALGMVLPATFSKPITFTGVPSLQRSCDLSGIKLPQTSESLPEIPEGQQLLGVTVGRGTQNYTCGSFDAATTPEAGGALATLFNASCVATGYPYLLSLLPNVALQLSNPPTGEALGIPNVDVAGQHYFSNGTTAVFDMAHLGASSVMKENSVDAPETAMQGTNDESNGAVGWLFLTSIPESEGQAKTIYRVNTAGGKPPENCVGQEEEIAIDYAAEYWFYG